MHRRPCRKEDDEGFAMRSAVQLSKSGARITNEGLRERQVEAI
jgi:hypothetical protein